MNHPLVIFLGECNSCGFVSKTTLTPEEHGIWPDVEILNNLTLKVEPLDMDSNNFLAHETLHNNRAYGWELFLAKQARSQRWPDIPIYLVKGGQGGTSAYEFRDNKSNFYAIFLMRVRSMLNQVGACSPVIWYQQGSNEPANPTKEQGYKKSVLGLFENIRRDLGMFPIIMTKQLPATQRLNSVVEEIAQESPQVSWVDTEEANKTCSNPQHWDRRGIEITAEALCEATLAQWSGSESHL